MVAQRNLFKSKAGANLQSPKKSAIHPFRAPLLPFAGDMQRDRDRNGEAMFITQIDITALNTNDHDSLTRAHVAITSDSGRVLVDCHLPLAQIEPTEHRHALMHEAIRQLRRMPEYRSGKREILLADGLLA
jgi:hypothetical protein